MTAKKQYLNVLSVSGNAKDVYWGKDESCNSGYSNYINENSNTTVFSNSNVKVEAYLTSSSSFKISGSRNYNVKFKFTNLTNNKISKKEYGLPEVISFCVGGCTIEYKLKQPKNLAVGESYEKETFDFYAISTPPLRVKF
jgi:hypothetical protein